MLLPTVAWQFCAHIRLAHVERLKSWTWYAPTSLRWRRRRGTWDLIETAGLKLAKSEIKRLNDELEQRVRDRTNELNVGSERCARPRRSWRTSIA